VPQPGGLRAGQLQGMQRIVTPGAKINRIPCPPTFMQAHDVFEEGDALFEFRGEYFYVAQVRDVLKGRLIGHGTSLIRNLVDVIVISQAKLF
jgi:hypothetical protein